MNLRIVFFAFLSVGCSYGMFQPAVPGEALWQLVARLGLDITAVNNNLYSLVHGIDSQLETVTFSLPGTIVSTLDQIVLQDAATLSLLEQISSQVETISIPANFSSSIATLQTQQNVIVSVVDTISSTVDQIAAQETTSISLLEGISSQVETISIPANFSSSIATIQTQQNTILSVADSISSNVDHLTMQEAATYSVLEGVSSQVGTLVTSANFSSSIATLQTQQNSIFSVVELMDSALGQIESSIDALECPHSISQANIPFVTPSSGVYCVTGPLVLANGQTAITINQNNVTLEMNGFSITATSTMATTGIMVVNAQGVVISNGIINDVSYGITFTTASAIDCSDVIVNTSGQAAFTVSGCSSVNITDCVSNNGLIYGFYIEQFSYNVYLNNCIANNTTSTAFFINTGYQTVVTNCIAQQTGMTGFRDLNGSSNQFVSCMSTAHSVNGFSLESNGGFCINCIAQGTF